MVPSDGCLRTGRLLVDNEPIEWFRTTVVCATVDNNLVNDGTYHNMSASCLKWVCDLDQPLKTVADIFVGEPLDCSL